MEHNIKELANKHSTFLQDTPDFLRNIEELNNKGELSNESILVSIDVTGLYTNIPQDEGLEAVKEALAEKDNLEVPTETLRSCFKI